MFYIVVALRNYNRDTHTNWNTKLCQQPKYQDIYHLIVLPTYNESLEVLRTSFNGLKSSTFDPKKMIVVLAGEERGGEGFVQRAGEIKKEFGDHFYKLLITIHPDNISGEIKGKGANANYAGHQVQKFIDEQKIPYENVIVSYFDSDTIAHPQYFSYLTYKYLTHPNPTRASYQPVVIYSNNIWDAPAINRISAFSTTFWLLSELVRPDRLFTFSSHSMSFKALVDV
ncbi:glycosyltransferase family 2 protein, partial [Candidatus Uhrbacteria bacterium]|nr:glycosyltransferase family 2 protein [Candidatus Uhrbacteria bacterium]